MNFVRSGISCVVFLTLMAAVFLPQNPAEAIPAARPFAMGFTPYPYDATVEAWSETFDLVNAHADMLTHHFDDGIPWQEAFEKTPYRASILGSLEFRRARTGENKRIYLAVTPISNLRDDLAGEWTDLPSQPRTGPWAHRGFGNPEVRTAYLNHCRFLIEWFKPDWFAYAVEVDILFDKRPDLYPAFLKLARKTYRTLKREYPDLPIFLTITTAGQRPEFDSRRAAMQKALRYSDYVAVSTYPYLTMGGEGNPRGIEKDLLIRMAALAPDKPFAIAETGYPAEPLELPSVPITIPARPAWQKRYASWLLTECEALDAEFVSWFCVVDYDRLWDLMEEQGVSDLFKAWRDTGFFDGQLQPRPALKIWEKWRAIPYN